MDEVKIKYIGPQGSYSKLGSKYQEALKEFGLGSVEIIKRVENMSSLVY
jgi:transketolase C-terminal domain/subunit